MNAARHTTVQVLNRNQKHKTLPTTSGVSFLKLTIKMPAQLLLFVVISRRSSGDIVGAIDWHSFSQLILRPYGIHHNEHFHLGM